MQLNFIPVGSFDQIHDAVNTITFRLELISDMCRLNTLNAVKKAGSGHLGSSFSSMDLFVFLYHYYLNLRQVGLESPDRDIFFSSKGHDVPGTYAVLASLGIVSMENLQMIRRFGGLDGHPDTSVAGIEVNTGSLGMGISKGKGISIAKRYLKRQGRVVVLIGDGEFQEGQNFEALQSAVPQEVNNLTVIMDHNKLQSDRYVNRIVDLGDLQAKIETFGWHVVRCDGNSISDLVSTFEQLDRITGKPKFVICDTIKGKGVSFMEHPRALEENDNYYRFHAGAPDDDLFAKANEEIRSRIESDLEEAGLQRPDYQLAESRVTGVSGVTDQFVAAEYGATLVRLAKDNEKFVVLDADLSLDCRLREFEDTYPDRFVEVGIAEQDMVSMACGVAHQGLVPVINSFASFLCSRANEQIYNALTENRKMVFAAHFSGLIPAAPGKSHQSVRDISLFEAFPNCAIIHPSTPSETAEATRYAIEESSESTLLRLAIGPCPRDIKLPDDYSFTEGVGAVLTEGEDGLLFAYGPVMLCEALKAQEELVRAGKAIMVINMPWINRFDNEWLDDKIERNQHIFVLEDHSVDGGLGDRLLHNLVQREKLGERSFRIFGVEDFPVCGTPQEALEHHELDGISVARRIMKLI